MGLFTSNLAVLFILVSTTYFGMPLLAYGESVEESKREFPSSAEVIFIQEVRRGAVRIIKPNDSKFNAKSGTAVLLNDVVQTSSLGTILLRFTDGTQAIVGPRSRLQMKRIEKIDNGWSTHLFLKYGQIRFMRPKKPLRELQLFLETDFVSVANGSGEYSLTVSRKDGSNFLFLRNGTVQWKHQYFSEKQVLKNYEYAVLGPNFIEYRRTKEWNESQSSMGAVKRIFTEPMRDLQALIEKERKAKPLGKSGQSISQNPSGASTSIVISNASSKDIDPKQKPNEEAPKSGQAKLPTGNIAAPEDASKLTTEDKAKLASDADSDSFDDLEKDLVNNSFAADPNSLGKDKQTSFFSPDDRDRIAIEECGKKGDYFKSNQGYCNSVNTLVENNSKRSPACVNVGSGGNASDCLSGFNHSQYEKQDPIVFRCGNDAEFRGQNLDACRSAELKSKSKTDQVDIDAKGANVKKNAN